jgi:hypothetical protein
LPPHGPGETERQVPHPLCALPDNRIETGSKSAPARPAS